MGYMSGTDQDSEDNKSQRRIVIMNTIAYTLQIRRLNFYNWIYKNICRGGGDTAYDFRIAWIRSGL